MLRSSAVVSDALPGLSLMLFTLLIGNVRITQVLSPVLLDSIHRVAQICPGPYFWASLSPWLGEYGRRFDPFFRHHLAAVGFFRQTDEKAGKNGPGQHETESGLKRA